MDIKRPPGTRAFAAAARGQPGALATIEQLEAERFANSLLNHPELSEMLEVLRRERDNDPMVARPLGAERLAVALRQWATSLILREAAGDPQAPKMLWVGDTTPRMWFGHTLAGAALAGDNPDVIYRHAFVDGRARYELRGRFPQRPPAQFSIEPIPGLAGVIPPTGTLTGTIGTTSGPALLTDEDIRCEADGSFRIALGGEAPADGRNHLALPAEPMAINLRDLLSEWDQQPIPLSIHRLSTLSADPFDQAQIRRRVLEHLPAYVRHWAGFKDRWLGGIAPNTFRGPLGRAGAWSYILAGRYALSPGQAIVITAHAGGAGYHGAQVTDHWQVTLDNARHQGSLNGAQATPNTDGSVTYVIAANDPGVANWLDTGFCLDGFFLMRWQLFGPQFEPDKVVRGFEVINLREVERRPFPRVTPQERRERLARRAGDYAIRLSA